MARAKKAAAATPAQPALNVSLVEGASESPSVEGAKSTEVLTKSESEAPLQEMSENTASIADQVQKRWREREAKEGTKYYISPFDRGKDNAQTFPTAAKCLAYMRKEQKNQMTLAKKQGQPCDPVEKIKSPKRTLADFVPPQVAARMAKMQEAQKQTTTVREQAKALAGGGIKASNLFAMTEQAAMAYVPKLSNDELANCARLAWSRSKDRLLKVCRLHCNTRGIKLDF